MKRIADFPWGALYAKRTAAGGLCYFDDTVGGGNLVLDMTVVDTRMVRFVLENHADIEAVFDRLPLLKADIEAERHSRAAEIEGAKG